MRELAGLRARVTSYVPCRVVCSAVFVGESGARQHIERSLSELEKVCVCMRVILPLVVCAIILSSPRGGDGQSRAKNLKAQDAARDSGRAARFANGAIGRRDRRCVVGIELVCAELGNVCAFFGRW